MTVLAALLAAVTLLAARGFDTDGLQMRTGFAMPADVYGAACAPDMAASRALCAEAGASDGTMLINPDVLADTALLANIIAHEAQHLRGPDKSERAAYVAGCLVSWVAWPCDAVARWP